MFISNITKDLKSSKKLHPACCPYGTRIRNRQIASPTHCRLFGHAAYYGTMPRPQQKLIVEWKALIDSNVLPTLTTLLNFSFACSEFPRAWKKSVIVPHLKDGDHEVPNNNWPISLLPVLSKVAEKIALIQFNDFLTKQDKLTQHQNGNRKNHSTETLSLLVTDHMFRAIDQGHPTRI